MSNGILGYLANTRGCMYLYLYLYLYIYRISGYLTNIRGCMSLAMLAFHLWEHSEVGDSKYKIIKSNHPVIIILFKNSNHQLTLYNQEANRQICAHPHHLIHRQLLLHLLGQPRSQVYHHHHHYIYFINLNMF